MKVKEIDEIRRDMNEPLDVKQDIPKTQLLSWVNVLLSRIRTLEEGIMELIAYGMPKHIEEGLQKLLEDE